MLEKIIEPSNNALKKLVGVITKPSQKASLDFIRSAGKTIRDLIGGTLVATTNSLEEQDESCGTGNFLKVIQNIATMYEAQGIDLVIKLVDSFSDCTPRGNKRQLQQVVTFIMQRAQINKFSGTIWVIARLEINKTLLHIRLMFMSSREN